MILSGNDHYSALIYIKDEDSGVVIGHELLTSGLAQGQYDYPMPPAVWLSSFIPEPGVELRMYPREHLTGPHFAEVFVSPAKVEDGPLPLPELELRIYTTRAPDIVPPGRLSNVLTPEGAPLPVTIPLRYDRVPDSCLFQVIPYSDIIMTNTAYKFTSCVTDVYPKAPTTNWDTLFTDGAPECREYFNLVRCANIEEWLRSIRRTLFKGN